MALEKKQPVKCNPFCILKAYFSQLVLWQSLRSFLVQRSGDINSKRAQLLPSDRDNREIIHIYSFGKRRAQHWFYSTPAFLLWSPWENKAPSLWEQQQLVLFGSPGWMISLQRLTKATAVHLFSLVQFWFTAWRKSFFSSLVNICWAVF